MTRQRTAPFASIDEIAWAGIPGGRYPPVRTGRHARDAPIEKHAPNAGTDPVRARHALVLRLASKGKILQKLRCNSRQSYSLPGRLMGKAFASCPPAPQRITLECGTALPSREGCGLLALAFRGFLWTRQGF